MKGEASRLRRLNADAGDCSGHILGSAAWNGVLYPNIRTSVGLPDARGARCGPSSPAWIQPPRPTDWSQHVNIRQSDHADRPALVNIVSPRAGEDGRCAFTRPEDVAGQAFVQRLGATGIGASNEMPPKPLDAAIIFATVGDLVPLALRAVRKGSPRSPCPLLRGAAVLRP